MGNGYVQRFGHSNTGERGLGMDAWGVAGWGRKGANVQGCSTCLPACLPCCLPRCVPWPAVPGLSQSPDLPCPPAGLLCLPSLPAGEHWDQTEQMDTYYNPIPHFGYDLALAHSPIVSNCSDCTAGCSAAALPGLLLCPALLPCLPLRAGMHLCPRPPVFRLGLPAARLLLPVWTDPAGAPPPHMSPARCSCGACRCCRETMT